MCSRDSWTSLRMEWRWGHFNCSAIRAKEKEELRHSISHWRRCECGCGYNQYASHRRSSRPTVWWINHMAHSVPPRDDKFKFFSSEKWSSVPDGRTGAIFIAGQCGVIFFGVEIVFDFPIGKLLIFNFLSRTRWINFNFKNSVRSFDLLTWHSGPEETRIVTPAMTSIEFLVRKLPSHWLIELEQLMKSIDIDWLVVSHSICAVEGTRYTADHQWIVDVKLSGRSVCSFYFDECDDNLGKYKQLELHCLRWDRRRRHLVTHTPSNETQILYHLFSARFISI